MRKLVFTFNFGEDKFLSNFRDSQREAARRWGADYLEITKTIHEAENEKRLRAFSEKLHIDKYVSGYDRIVYLDRDIIVNANCPNLFDEVPEGTFGAVPVYCPVRHFGNFNQYRDVVSNVSREEGVTLDVKKEYINSGVMVFDMPAHAEVFEIARQVASRTRHKGWQAIDQGCYSVAIKKSGVKAKYLDFEFNARAFAVVGEDKIPMNAHVWHFAGRGNGPKMPLIDWTIPAKQEIFFVHIPKNAGTSILSAAKGKLVPHKQMHLKARRQSHLFGDRYHRAFRFAVCRHPLDRFVSAFYFYKDLVRRRKHTAIAFDINEAASKLLQSDGELDDIVFKKQTDWLNGPPMHRILRYERLAEEWEEMVNVFEFDKLPRLNTSVHEPWQKELHTDSEKILREFYAADFRRFGYK